MVAAIAPKVEPWQMLLQSFSETRNPERQLVQTCGKLLRRWLGRCTRSERVFPERYSGKAMRSSLPDTMQVQREVETWRQATTFAAGSVERKAGLLLGESSGDIKEHALQTIDLSSRRLLSIHLSLL